jgi:LysR family nitrogen assimilation transcriptional regulator
VPLTRAFKQQLPQAHLTLNEGFSVLMCEGLRVGNIDIAVLYNAEHSPELEMTTLHTEELVLISKTDPAFNQATDQPTNKATNKAQKIPKTQKCQYITLTEVAKLPLILPSRPNAFRILIEGEMNAIGRKPDITLEVDGLNAILSLVKEGMGHAVLPSYTLSNFDDPSPFQVRSITEPRIMSQLMLVRAARRPSTETQKKTIEVVTSVLMDAIKPHH